MSSQIDATKPEQGQATTASVRANFAAAKDEILDLQAAVGDLETFTGYLDQLKAMIEAGTLTFSGGNVGIGTNNPQRKLTVQGAASDNVPVRVMSGTDSVDCFIDIKDPTTTADYRVRVGSVGDDLVLYAGGTERMRVDASGRVKKPHNPVFFASMSNTQAGPGILQFNIAPINIGDCFNTGTYRFTAPIAGKYTFGYHNNHIGSDSALYADFYKNGGFLGYGRMYSHYGGGWEGLAGTIIASLEAGDYMQMHLSSVHTADAGVFGGFYGYLIG